MEVDADGEPVQDHDEGRDLRTTLDAVTAALEATGDQQAAIVGYRGVLDYEVTDPSGPSDTVGKVKEEAIYGLAKAYADSKRSVDGECCVYTAVLPGKCVNIFCAR